MTYEDIDKGFGLPLKANFVSLEKCSNPTSKISIGAGNYPAKKVYTPPTDNCFLETYFYYIQKDYDYFIIPRPSGGVGYIGYDGEIMVKKSLSEFNQILSTFRFTR